MPSDFILAELRVSPMDEGLNREAYQELQRDLVDLGVHARLVVDRPVEFRNVPPEAVAVATQLGLWLADYVKDAVLDAIVERYRQRLSRRRPRGERIVVIYGPNGEVLRRVSLPETDE